LAFKKDHVQLLLHQQDLTADTQQQQQQQQQQGDSWLIAASVSAFLTAAMEQHCSSIASACRITAVYKSSCQRMQCLPCCSMQ
jgi:hypothetical protein